MLEKRIVIFIICILSVIAFAEEDYSKLPDVIICNFKVEAILNYSVASKQFEAKAGKDTSFSFKLAGVSRGKPVIIGENASNELMIIKKVGNIIYFAENLEFGYNILALFLSTKKVTLTKQYDVGNGSPYVYSWVGDAIY
jgi:hypothetical protein